MYTEHTIRLWVEAQVRDLNEYTTTKTKLELMQIEEVARVIIAEVYYMKLSELMLFFAYFKAGRYGNFFGCVDPLVITTALQTFKKERLQWITRLEQIEADKQREAMPTNDPSKLTYAEWKELKWLFNMGYERDANGKIT